MSEITAASTEITNPQVRNIPIDQLKSNPWNRTVFDAAALDELASSIKSEGIRERLIVRPLSVGTWQISSGHRRWLAAQKAGLRDVPCEIRSLTDEEVAEDNINLNIQREDLPLLEMARMVAAYMKDFDKTQEQAALRFCKPRTWATELAGFVPLIPLFEGNVAAATLGRDQLRALKSASLEVQTQVAKELKDGSLKPDQVAKRCKQLRISKKRAPSAPPPTDPLVDFWHTLGPDISDSPAYWEVKFGTHQVAKGANLNGWFLFVQQDPTGIVEPKAQLADFYQVLVDALRGQSKVQSPMSNVENLGVDQTLDFGHWTLDALGKVRLPKTPEEQKELENISVKGGPKKALEWIHGVGSPMTEVPFKTWDEIGMTPQEGLKQILDGLKKMQGSPTAAEPLASKPAAPKPEPQVPAAATPAAPDALKDGAAQIATDIAKNLLGRLFS